MFCSHSQGSERSRDGAVVRALPSHQCGPGSIPGLHVICELSVLLVLDLAPRGFSPGTLPLSSKTNNSTFQFDLNYCQALYHVPLTREIVQALPMLLTINKLLHLLLYFTLLCSTLLYSTLLYPTLPYPTLPYPTLPYPTLLYSTLLYSTLLYSTLLYSTLLYSTLLYSTLLYSTLLSQCIAHL